VHRLGDVPAEQDGHADPTGSQGEHQHEAHDDRDLGRFFRTGGHRGAVGGDLLARQGEQPRRRAIDALDRGVAGGGLKSGRLEGVECLAIAHSHLCVGGGEPRDQLAALARRQRGEQGSGLLVDSSLFLRERLPVLVQPGRIPASQQRVLPFLDLRLEADRERPYGTLSGMNASHLGSDRSERLVQAENADQGCPCQHGQHATEHQRQFESQVHDIAKDDHSESFLSARMPARRWAALAPGRARTSVGRRELLRVRSAVEVGAIERDIEGERASHPDAADDADVTPHEPHELPADV
jgi:hypothetical protein